MLLIGTVVAKAEQCHVLGEQRRIQIVLGMAPYRRRQGPENVFAIL